MVQHIIGNWGTNIFHKFYIQENFRAKFDTQNGN